ncbi:MAG: UDP-N-acetylmuramate--L-alanine ligase [Paludibacteraceae bacterium]|nr:UDP-N-acetylmuramate--L-alanine ligase [Paludibacteraceae bacterium]
MQTIFFLGIGGIGMSALARYFHHRGYEVAGYDRTPSPLTKELENEGIPVTYDDEASVMEDRFAAYNAKHTLVVRTPAVPEDSVLYTFFREWGYDIRKRAEVLGLVTRQMRALCVAGTHGKTTTSTMLAHLLYQSELGTNAFLGGISVNYGTNLLLDKNSSTVVVEADEYDRSFLHLTPYMSVVTAVDADHLDIYGTPEAYREAFSQYTSLITGALVMKHGIALEPRLQPGVKCYTYGVLNDQISNDHTASADRSRPCRDKKCQISNDIDFYAANIRVGDGRISFDFHTPTTVLPDVRLGVPVWVNIENAVAAMAVAWLNGVTEEELRCGIASFKGVQRRFNIHVNTPEVTYIDDYAHHPEEIATAIDSIRKLFPSRRLIGVFQPHLYTRTRDFAKDFARVLSTLDEVVLLPIYPARELPIAGVDSEMLLDKITNPNKKILQKAALVEYLSSRKDEGAVILTVGAGDIDRLVSEITKMLKK